MARLRSAFSTARAATAASVCVHTAEETQALVVTRIGGVPAPFSVGEAFALHGAVAQVVVLASATAKEAAELVHARGQAMVVAASGPDTSGAIGHFPDRQLTICVLTDGEDAAEAERILLAARDALTAP